MPPLAAVLLLGGCACLFNEDQLDQFNFLVFHPQELRIYKPVAVHDSGPSDDKAILYLALQNNSLPKETFCFACWVPEKHAWDRGLTHDLALKIDVAKEGSVPILGEPEVDLAGISNETVVPGKRFPEVIPDMKEFPLNEANYRRDFAIIVHPDRSKMTQCLTSDQPPATYNPAKTGFLRVKVSLARTGKEKPGDGTSQIADFRIPVIVCSDYRPEGMTVQPSAPPQ
jgi:hypothetical protein